MTVLVACPRCVNGRLFRETMLGHDRGPADWSCANCGYVAYARSPEAFRVNDRLVRLDTKGRKRRREKGK